MYAFISRVWPELTSLRCARHILPECQPEDRECPGAANQMADSAQRDTLPTASCMSSSCLVLGTSSSHSAAQSSSTRCLHIPSTATAAQGLAAQWRWFDRLRHRSVGLCSRQWPVGLPTGRLQGRSRRQCSHTPSWLWLYCVCLRGIGHAAYYVLCFNRQPLAIFPAMGERLWFSAC